MCNIDTYINSDGVSFGWNGEVKCKLIDDDKGEDIELEVFRAKLLVRSCGPTASRVITSYFKTTDIRKDTKVYGVYKVVRGRDNTCADNGDSKWGECYPDGEVSGATDGSQVLVAFEESMKDLKGRVGGGDLEMKAFRPNVVLGGGEKWDEDRVRTLHFKEGELWGRKLCHRCVMCTVDEGKGEWGGFRKGFEPLKTMRTFRCAKDERYGDSPIFGLNCGGKGVIRMEDYKCRGRIGDSNLGRLNIAEGYK
ncbi:hypothetical protein TrCOL_g3349 [Triparma columacea]|uniref:MOSC domain-containing protein n=1 Tax=Triparma columacea TaxID=722753 RepID=A0A9W7LCU3_9STRA|nr:hypothetical protein TrCOL_g3349 [Triparma columacea]